MAAEAVVKAESQFLACSVGFCNVSFVCNLYGGKAIYNRCYIVTSSGVADKSGGEAWFC